MPVCYLPYSEYKPSPVHWHGVLPSHWGCRPLKHLCRFQGGGTPSKDVEDYWHGDIPWVSPKDMKRKLINSSEDFITAKAIDGSSTRLVKEGALLMVVRSGILQRTIPVAITTEAVTLNQDMKAIIFGAHMAAWYAFYYIEGNQSNLLLDWSKQGATVESIEHEYLSNSMIPVPSIDEQQNIVKFLDYETAKIDSLIDKQQQLIKLLKEKRQAVISHAVTKGLNPHAPMKDSGVEWLGEVPEHWDVTRVKFIAKLESGHTPDKKIDAYWTDCSIPWVSLNDSQTLKEVDYITDTKYKINLLGIENSSARLLPERCVVFTRDASIGLTAITTNKMAVSQHIIAWVCDETKVLPEFLLLVFYAMQDELERYTFGATIKTIGLPDVKKLVCARPNLSEQREVVRHVFRKKEAIDSAIGKVERSIDLLKERRVALISAAVTGKIDLRDWEPAQTKQSIPMEACA